MMQKIINNKGKHSYINRSFLCSYMISEFPQIIYPNWLYTLMNYNEPLILSQFIKPVDPRKALSGLRNRITNLSAEHFNRQEKGKVHTVDLEQAIQDARMIENSIVRGTEKLYSMSMYALLQKDSLEELQKSERNLKDVAYAKQLKLHPLMYKQKEGLENFLPNNTDKISEELYLTSSNICSTLPFTSTTLNDLNGIFYGISLEGSKVNFDRFSKSSKNFNGIVFATSGAGKSFAVKLEIYRSLFEGVQVFVIDPEGEFKKLCEKVGGTHIEINPESKIKVNPLQFFSTENKKEVMRTHLGVVKGLLKIWLSESVYNKGLVSKIVNETYRAKGILLEDKSTYANTPPTISDLIEECFKHEIEGKRIASELQEYSKEGIYGDLYDNPTSSEINFNAPLIVFNTQKVPEDQRQSTTYYLSNFIWQKVLSNREKKILVIDEAHLLLKEDSSANFIENLVRRGRKYNLGVICISQDVDDFLLSKQGSVIAKNAETALLLSQKKQSLERITKAFDLSQAEQDYLMRLNKGQGLFIKGNSRSPLYIYATLHEKELFSSNASDF